MESMLGGTAGRRTARSAVLAAAALALVALPARAGAAYDPHLAVTVTPTSAASHLALTTTLTQASGEDANRSVRFHFPVGFTLDGSALGAMPACGDPSNCPADSSLGTAAADTPLGAFTGSVFLGTNQRIFVVLKGAVPGLLDQRL